MNHLSMMWVGSKEPTLIPGVWFYLDWASETEESSKCPVLLPQKKDSDLESEGCNELCSSGQDCPFQDNTVMLQRGEFPGICPEG